MPVHPRAILARRRGSSGSLTFESISGYARPANPTGGRSVTFTTSAGLSSAVTNLQAGDVIRYTGTGVLTISSSSSTAFTIASKNPSSVSVIDFGTSRSVWSSSTVSGNYVKFSYTGSANQGAFWINGCSNLRLYGADITTGIGGVGYLINAPSHDLLWYDFACHDTGNSGVAVRGTTSSGAASDVSTLDLRGETDRFAMNPSLDNHPDRGTGLHGCILHGNVGDIHDSRFTIYAHDPLRPGEVSAGQTWPEGGGGSACEVGNVGTSNYSNCTFYVKGVNLLMQPYVAGVRANPGSTASQTGGNVFNWWGNIPLNGNRVGWGEGINITGAVSHGAGGSWFPGNPPVTFDHGRGTNTNQYTGAGGNITQRYDPAHGIVYNDCL